MFTSALWYLIGGAALYQHFPKLEDFTNEEQNYLGTSSRKAKESLAKLADLDLEPEDQLDQWILTQYYELYDINPLDLQNSVISSESSKLEKYADVTDGMELSIIHQVYLSTIPALKEGLPLEELTIKSPATKDDLLTQATLFGPPMLSDKHADKIIARLQRVEAQTTNNYRWRIQRQKDIVLKYGMQSFTVLFLPPIALLLLFLSIRWVYRGFRPTKDE